MSFASVIDDNHRLSKLLYLMIIWTGDIITLERGQHITLESFSEEAAEESKKFVVSTVVNKEFATRLSINSIVQLRDSVLSAIQINHRSKVRGFFNFLCSPFEFI